MKYKKNSNVVVDHVFTQGITLISLVITIILLLILAGIGINLSIGENGLFNKAKYAKEKYLNAQAFEEEQLNELYEELGLLGDLPENTPETNAGTIVKMPSSWETSTPYYVSTETGKEIISSKKVASVYAVSTGDGKSVPVPLGFYYVGGDYSTGVVISDNKEDKYEQGKDKTTHEYATKLKGNQFIWIPCNIDNYHKIDWGKETSKWDIETYESEYWQIEKYDGFYIGRYEAGVGTLNEDKKANNETDPFDYSVTFNGNASLFNAVEIQEGINGWLWQNYNFTTFKQGIPLISGSNKATGNIVVKANSIPYYHSDYYTATEMSRRLYSNNQYVKSGLVTGTMWDVMLKYIKETGNVDITTSTWGNYDNVALSNLRGYYTNVTYSTNRNTLGATDGFKSCENLITTNSGINSYVILTTGSTEQVKKMNLYDVAGNLWEWTQEASYINNLNYNTNIAYNSYINRGGGFDCPYTTYPPTIRGDNYGSATFTNRGFRIALYLQ